MVTIVEESKQEVETVKWMSNKWLRRRLFEMGLILAAASAALGFRCYVSRTFHQAECYETSVEDSPSTESYFNGLLIGNLTAAFARFISDYGNKGFAVTRKHVVFSGHWEVNEVVLFSTTILFCCVTLLVGNVFTSGRNRYSAESWWAGMRAIKFFLLGLILLSVIADSATAFESRYLEHRCPGNMSYHVTMASYMSSSTIVFVTVSWARDCDGMRHMGRALYVALTLTYSIFIDVHSYLLFRTQLHVFFTSAVVGSLMAAYVFSMVFNAVCTPTSPHAASLTRRTLKITTSLPFSKMASKDPAAGAENCPYIVVRKADGQMCFVPMRATEEKTSG